MQSSSAAVTVPRTVSVAAGSSTAAFTVNTTSVNSTVNAGITAAISDGQTISATLTVAPPPLANLILSPTIIVGGNSTTGTVSLPKAAATGGETVSLSSNLATVTVPTTVVIPTGSASATFPVTTMAVTTQANATVTASLGNSSVTANLSVFSTLGLANSAWPKAHGDLRNTGRSSGKGATGTFGWGFKDIGTPAVKIVTGSDGTLYFNSNAGYLCAMTPAGALKWKLLTNAVYPSNPLLSPDGTVYFLDTNGLVAVSSAGAVKWTSTKLTYGSTLGCVGPDGTLYATTAYSVMAISPNGSVKWYARSISDSTFYACNIGTDGTIYASGYNYVNAQQTTGFLTALSPSGQIKWTTNFPYIPFYNYPPILEPNGTVVLPCSGAQQSNDQLVAVSPDGALITAASYAYSFYTLTQGPDGTMYICDGTNLHAISTDLTEKWSVQGLTSQVVVSNGTIYATSGTGVAALDSTGAVHWRYATTGVVLAIGAATDGTLYIGTTNSMLQAVSPSGSLSWEYELYIRVIGTPTLGPDGTVYAGALNGKLYALGADGAEKWEFQTKGPIRSSPAIGIDGTIFVGSTDHNMYAISPQGKLIWSYTTGSSILSSATIAQSGMILFGSDDGYLYALNYDGSFRWKAPVAQCESTPAIGSDGTIYVGDGGLSSSSSFLRAFDPSGNQKWSFALGYGPFKFDGCLVGMTPVIGDDGSIYISNQTNMVSITPGGIQNWTAQIYDNDPSAGLGPYYSCDPAIELNGNIIQPACGIQLGCDVLNSEGLIVGFLPQSQFLGACAITADGNVYCSGMNNSLIGGGTLSPFIQGFSASGALLWNVNVFSAGYCPPGIGQDGTIYVGGYGISAIH